jgi:hypothetical protein
MSDARLLTVFHIPIAFNGAMLNHDTGYGL